MQYVLGLGDGPLVHNFPMLAVFRRDWPVFGVSDNAWVSILTEDIADSEVLTSKIDFVSAYPIVRGSGPVYAWHPLPRL